MKKRNSLYMIDEAGIITRRTHNLDARARIGDASGLTLEQREALLAELRAAAKSVHFAREVAAQVIAKHGGRAYGSACRNLENLPQ